MNKFKNGGVWKTETLFRQTCRDGVNSPEILFTLDKEDHPSGKHRSLYKLYMQEQDLTEVHFAEKHLGGYAHWKKLLKAKWFLPHITLWREELELKMMAKGLATLKDALSEDKVSDRMFAAKFFANRGWEQAIKQAKGIATKDKRTKKEDLVNTLVNHVDDDFDRLITTPLDKVN